MIRRMRHKISRSLTVYKARLMLLLFTIGRVLFSYRYRFMKAITSPIMWGSYWLYSAIATYRLKQGMPIVGYYGREVGYSRYYRRSR